MEHRFYQLSIRYVTYLIHTFFCHFFSRIMYGL